MARVSISPSRCKLYLPSSRWAYHAHSTVESSARRTFRSTIADIRHALRTGRTMARRSSTFVALRSCCWLCSSVAIDRMCLSHWRISASSSATAIHGRSAVATPPVAQSAAWLEPSTFLPRAVVLSDATAEEYLDRDSWPYLSLVAPNDEDVAEYSLAVRLLAKENEEEGCAE